MQVFDTGLVLCSPSFVDQTTKETQHMTTLALAAALNSAADRFEALGDDYVGGPADDLDDEMKGLALALCHAPATTLAELRAKGAAHGQYASEDIAPAVLESILKDIAALDA
jgi:hypothetical protein